MIRRVMILGVLASVACTDPGTDPNAVIAVRFDGSAYPSIVAGDSLRDSLGALQPLKATGLNYKGEAVAGAEFVFSSPDTVLKMANNGNVFAIRLKADANPARVFATVGSLQSLPDTLFVVPRADSIRALKDVDTLPIAPNGVATTGDSTLKFNIFGDTAAGKPKVLIPAWLVSFQLLYHGALLPPTDTSKAFTYVVVGSGAASKLKPTFVDSTDAGTAQRGVRVQGLSTSVAEDTIFLIATARARLKDVPPFSDTTMLILRRQ